MICSVGASARAQERPPHPDLLTNLTNRLLLLPPHRMRRRGNAPRHPDLSTKHPLTLALFPEGERECRRGLGDRGIFRGRRRWRRSRRSRRKGFAVARATLMASSTTRGWRSHWPALRQILARR